MRRRPHVERLIEAFAYLTARIRTKLDDEFPEITASLLSVLYPHYLAPSPLDGDRAVPGGPGAGAAHHGLHDPPAHASWRPSRFGASRAGTGPATR